MAPIAVMQVVRPGERLAAIATRWTFPLLLAPIVGAFFQLLVFHRTPSIVWPFLVLVAAIATRVLRAHGGVTERAAALGIDGLALDGRFVAAPEIVGSEQEDALLWVTTASGERIELRIGSADLERVKSMLPALTSAASASSRDAAGERFLADGAASRDPRAGGYRELAFDAERCIAMAEDASAAPRVRIAAAELLAEMGADDPTRARIAVVAETTASPELREALHAALTHQAPSLVR